MSAVKQSDRLGSVPTPRGRAAGEVEPDVRETTRQATLPTQLSAPTIESIGTQTPLSVPNHEETTGPLTSAPSPRWLTRPRQVLRIVAIGTVAVVLVGAVMLSRADADARSAEVARAQAHAAAIDAIRATVQVTIPVLTMTGASTEPVLLAGYGPIAPDTAAVLAAGAPGWERVMTSPVSGNVIAVDRYRPGPALQRFLAALDERCRFPGCRRPVWRCDIDHTIDAAHGGPTTTCNLAHLCRRHHTLKHATDWTVTQHPDGTLEWTSPTGRRHLDHPPTTLRFHPSSDPPPF